MHVYVAMQLPRGAITRRATSVVELALPFTSIDTKHIGTFFYVAKKSRQV